MIWSTINVRWHPNRKDYSVQQFLANQICNSDDRAYYSFAKMQPYLGPAVRIKNISILIAGDLIYNPDHVSEMESISNVWSNGHIEICNANNPGDGYVPEDFLPILNSPTILQCRYLTMNNVHFSIKDYKVLYSVNFIDTCYDAKYEEKIDYSYWTEFFEQPGVKPIVVLQYSRHMNTESLVDRLSKAFLSAVLPNAFKVLFTYYGKSLTEFQETNKTSGEKLELKKGVPTNCESIYPENFDKKFCYTLERSSI